MIEGIQSSYLFYPVPPVRGVQERYASPPETAEEQAERVYRQSDQVEISPQAWAQYAAASASGQTVTSVKESKDDQSAPSKNPNSPATPTQNQGIAVKPADHSGKSSDQKQGNSSNGETKKELTDGEKHEISRLQQRDAEVRAHEQAHLATAGSLAAGGANYDFEEGPDGNRYAVGGEVPIASGSGDTPEARLQNAEQVHRAALAPANPSSQDRSIAAQATSDAMQARTDLVKEQTSKLSGDHSATSADSSAEAKPSASEKPDKDNDSSADSAASATKSPWQKAIDAYKSVSEGTSAPVTPKSPWQKAIDAYKAQDNSKVTQTPFTTTTSATAATTQRINVSA